jgi:uncharacterized protein (TIGR02996 family)
MAVYFAYRCHYAGPTEKYLKRFDEDTILDWFRNRWESLADTEHAVASKRVQEALGISVYGFGSLFWAAAEHSLPPPRTNAQLHRYLEQHLYVEGTCNYSPHLMQVLTDDDELDMAYFFFDDHYLAKHRDLAAFLLYEDWKLPAGAGDGKFRPGVKAKDFEPGGQGEGETYVVYLVYYSSGNLDDLKGPRRFRGVRLPELARHLLRSTPKGGWPSQGGWEFEPRLLRAGLALPDETLSKMEQAFTAELRSSPSDAAAWNAYSDWLMERDQPGAGLVLLERALRQVAQCPVVPMGGGSWEQWLLGAPEEAGRQLKEDIGKLRRHYPHQQDRSLVRVDEHVAQLCLPTGRGNSNLYHQWIYFDDLWASAHADLANAILRFSSRWDVLTVD